MFDVRLDSVNISSNYEWFVSGIREAIVSRLELVIIDKAGAIVRTFGDLPHTQPYCKWETIKTECL